MSTITWTTAFYDLGSMESNPHRRPKSEYLKHGEFVLSLDINLVIYCDPIDVIYFLEQRDFFGLSDKTQIIGKPFTALPYYKYKNIMMKGWMINMPVFPHKLTMFYSQLMWCKTEMVGETMVNNPFKSSHFGWIDFGMAHFTGTTFRPNLNQILSDKIRLMQINYFSPSSLKMGTIVEKKYQYCNILDHVAGTLFTGRADYIEKYCARFSAKVFEALNAGFVPTDEPLIPLIIMDAPELFDVYYGDFYALLLNYEQTQGGHDKILRVFRYCIAEGNVEKLKHLWPHISALQWDDEQFEDILFMKIKLMKHSEDVKIYRDKLASDTFRTCYEKHKGEVDGIMILMGLQQVDGSFGKNMILTESECGQMIYKYFDDFIALQKYNKITGCGSYLFDGQHTLDYYPQQYPKQQVLYDYSKGKKKVLEIGVNHAHSCWIMLLANITKNEFEYIGIDTGLYDCTDQCVQLLQERYPNKIQVIKGECMPTLEKLRDVLHSFDLIHYDGPHDDVAVQVMTLLLSEVKKGTTFIFNDYDYIWIQKVFQYHGQRMEIVVIPQCPFKNCVAVKK